MKTPRLRKIRGRRGRKLGKISLDIEKSIDGNFGKELTEIPGHFMYNEDNDAIQQVLKLPDIAMSDCNEQNERNKRGLSLPPINADDKSSPTLRKQSGEPTKLPKINTELRPKEPLAKSSWLERQDVTTISWRKALDVLDDKTRDIATKQQKKPRRDREICPESVVAEA